MKLHAHNDIEDDRIIKKSTALATGISDHDEIAIILDNLLEDSLTDNTLNLTC